MAYRYETKLAIIALSYHRSGNIPAIARAFKIPDTTVRNWRRQFDAGEIKGALPKPPPEHVKRMLDALKVTRLPVRCVINGSRHYWYDWKGDEAGLRAWFEDLLEHHRPTFRDLGTL